VGPRTILDAVVKRQMGQIRVTLKDTARLYRTILRIIFIATK